MPYLSSLSLSPAPPWPSRTFAAALVQLATWASSRDCWPPPRRRRAYKDPATAVVFLFFFLPLTADRPHPPAPAAAVDVFLSKSSLPAGPQLFCAPFELALIAPRRLCRPRDPIFSNSGRSAAASHSAISRHFSEVLVPRLIVLASP